MEVTDSVFGCTVSDTVVITENPQIIIDSVITIQTTSCGAADGIIQIFASGGTPPYNYSIDGGANFIAINNFSGLLAGGYSVVIEDFSGCQLAYGSANINDPSPITIDSTNINFINCSDNGSIEIYATGSGNPLSYSIDGGVTFSASNVFSNLGVGVYDVEVREGLCNIIGGNYVFTDPSITIDSLNVTDDACNSSAQG